MEKILYIDDDKEELSRFQNFLGEDYQIICEHEAIFFDDHIKEHQFNAILLDVNMGVLDGFKLREKIIEEENYNQCPIIFKTSHKSEENIVKGLSINCEYLTPDMKEEEIKLRIKNQIKRHHVRNFGPLTLDIHANKITFEQEPLDLTTTEFEILRCLFLNNNKVKKDFFLETLWGQSVTVNPNTFNTHLANLRKKISSYGVSIKTSRENGYSLEHI